MTNPWISPTHHQAEEAGAVVPAPSQRPTGPTAPQPGVTAPDLVDQLSIRDYAVTSHLWVTGVHGGAGESTVAALIAGAWPTGHAWPRALGNYVTPRVLLVARSHAAGLEAARKAATHWASGALDDLQLVGLVIVADAPGRLPKPLRQLAQYVAGAAPRTWHLPWVEAWRLGQDVDVATSPRDVQRIVKEISSLLPPPGAVTGRPY